MKVLRVDNGGFVSNYAKAIIRAAEDFNKRSGIWNAPPAEYWPDMLIQAARDPASILLFAVDEYWKLTGISWSEVMESKAGLPYIMVHVAYRRPGTKSMIAEMAAVVEEWALKQGVKNLVMFSKNVNKEHWKTLGFEPEATMYVKEIE